NETYVYPSVLDGGWTVCLVLLSAAAWQRPRRAVAVEDQRGLRFTALPIAFATLGLAILVVAALHRLNAVAVLLAAASLLAVLSPRAPRLRGQRGEPAARPRGAPPGRPPRPGQPPRADPRPRARGGWPRRARAAGPLRPRRLQALQRLLRPPGRRRAAAAPR